ncbi:hypothetical protein TIFTF001_009852 [Ficus carica]|uniref:WRKY domain-containing protein n=1 Tax=Ficus carica TaxID=3494 RepID=A0AA87ZNX3_FICCA|nr:hypothetical protein TIFTF001_009852 [Ficus carica]
MASSLTANAASGRQKLIEQLVNGREIANQLQTLLSQSISYDGSVVDSTEDLASNIMESFTNTLFMLNQNDNDDDPYEVVVSQIQVQAAAATSSHVDNRSPCLDGRISEDSGESCRSVSTAMTRKDRRVCDKGRKTAYTWQRKTTALIDDGHAWRKYGQKRIIKSKHPRNYYRCTHKYEQKCQATKQVQKIQDNPPMYKTTYFGHHTCTNLQKSPELVLDCPTSPGHDSCMLFSFNNSHLNLKSKQAAPPFFASFASVKQESVKDDPTLQPCINDVNNDNNNNVVSHNQTSSPDYVVSSPDPHDHDHLPAFDHSPVWSSNFDSDIHGDVMSFDDNLFQRMNF